jgi:hypothetical protein
MKSRIVYGDVKKVNKNLSELWFWIDELEKKGISKKKILEILTNESGQSTKEDECTSKE